MHVRRALALTLAVPLLLAACSDDPEPTPNMPDPTSSSPSPTEAETPELESAEDFIRRWQAASDEAQLSGNTEPYRSLTRGCEPCDGFASRVEHIYGAGGRIEFNGSTVLGIRSDGPDSNGHTVRVRSSPATIVEAKGAEPTTLAGGELRLHVFLRKAGDSWLVGHYTILPSK